MLPEELAEELAPLGEPGFRGQQIFHWIHGRAVTDFGAMTNLPAALRSELGRRFCALPLRVVDRVAGESRGGRAPRAVKYLLELADGEQIEAVALGQKWGETACLSTQVGCPICCVFCASGRGGLRRNLSAGEIAGQVIALRQQGHDVRRVVFMGIGEPLLNLDALVQAIRVLCDKRGMGLPQRNVTISTVGLPEKIRALAQTGLRVRLTVSLQAPTDELRQKLVPHAPADVREILAAGFEYARAARRRLTVAYVVVPGVNDGREEARALAMLLKYRGALVNIVPFNPIGDARFTPDPGAAYRFQRLLAREGISATVRASVGLEAEAACGQLRARRAGEERVEEKQRA